VNDIQSAIQRFPRGLEQPSGTLRFGADALLLAAFAAHCANRGKAFRFAELGSGCGAAALAVALLCPQAKGLGLEREPQLSAAARRNAAALGLTNRLDFLCMDVAALQAPVNGENSLDMVMANPPYGLPGHGRPARSPMRERALRDPGALSFFCRTAARLLRHHGRFCCVFEAEALTRLCVELHTAGLGLRRLLPVRPHSQSPATRLLVEARKGAASRVQIEAPLTLHLRTNTSGQPGWTRHALNFCPWLGA